MTENLTKSTNQLTSDETCFNSNSVAHTLTFPNIEMLTIDQFHEKSRLFWNFKFNDLSKHETPRDMLAAKSHFNWRKNARMKAKNLL